MKWVVCGLVLVTLSAAGYFGYSIYSIRELSKRADSAASQPVAATSGPAVPHANVGQRVLSARNSAELATARDAARSGGAAAVDSLIAALQASPERASGQALRNQLCAIDLIANAGDPSAAVRLEPLARRRGLEREVLVARGLLGDRGISDALADAWLDATRSLLFIERFSNICGSDESAAASAAFESAHARAERLADAIRGVNSEAADGSVMERLLDAYWDSWSWLGQSRDERFSSAVWDLAKPRDSTDSDFRQRVRAARRVLDRTSRSGSPSARAAAGLVLLNSGPQYQSLKKDIIDTLASILPDASPLEQQRIAWSLTRLAGRPFGELTVERAPGDATKASIDAVLQWAAQQGIGKPSTTKHKADAFAAPPIPTRRVITRAAQIEADLSRTLVAGWPGAEAAIDAWRSERLGLTPRLAAELEPARAGKSPALLAAAIVAAVDAKSKDAPARLALLAEAAEQPEWVRAMAAVARALLTSDKAAGDWPSRLTSATVGDGRGDAPGTAVWARLVAAGGRSAVDRVRSGGSLAASVRDKLVREADRQLETTRSGGRR